MKVYNKFEVIPSEKPAIPDLDSQIADFDCHHCGRTMRVPVPKEFTDWETLAKEYKGALESMHKRMDAMIHDIDVMHQGNPVRDYIMNEWIMIELELRRRFEG